MTAIATAAQSPERPRPADTSWENLSLWLTARLPIVVEARVRNASTPKAGAMTTTRSRVANPSAKPAANPAGSHATSMRRSGWDPRLASSSRGNAPDSDGPWASR
jgi:hypothetical protein